MWRKLLGMVEAEEMPLTLHVPAGGLSNTLMLTGEDHAQAAAMEMEAFIETWRELDAYDGSGSWAMRLADGSFKV
jgi:hypothetical protein